MASKTPDEKIAIVRALITGETWSRMLRDELVDELLDFIDELTLPKCKPCPRYEPYTHLTMRNA